MMVWGTFTVKGKVEVELMEGKHNVEGSAVCRIIRKESRICWTPL